MQDRIPRILCSSTQYCKLQSTARELFAAHTQHRCSRISQLHEQGLHLQGAQLAALCPPAEPAKWRHQPLHSPQCQSKPAKKEDSAYKANSLAIVHASIAAADGLYLLSTQQAVGRDAKINKNMD